MERKRKRELRDLNTRTWAGETDVFVLHSSLDSSLKKNTAFIKRLRTALTATSTASVLQEIRSLSLHKYLSEVISASYEGLCRLKSAGEIAAGVEIISALHQRFGPGEYTSYLAWLIGRGLTTPDKSQLKGLSQDAREKEGKDRLGRQRVLLKVVTELWLVGLLRSLEDVARPEDFSSKGKENVGSNSKLGEVVSKAKAGKSNLSSDAEAFPLEVLKDLLGHDREHVNLSLVVSFVKSFSWDILGVASEAEKTRRIVEADGTVDGATDAATTDFDAELSSSDEIASGSDVADPPLIGPELQQRFKNILTRYLEDVKVHIVKGQEVIAAQGRRNAEVYVKSGEVFEDRQAIYDKQLKAQEKLVANAQILCDVLGSAMPELKDPDASDSAAVGGIGLVKTGDFLRGQSEGAGIWEDEEERRFYENLIDLKDRVPGILLEEVKKKKADSDEPVGKRNDLTGETKRKDSMDRSLADLADDQSTAIANKTVGAQVDALLTRLPELHGKEVIDQAAIDFCFLNSKASRNRLIKAVQDIPKGRSDLLPVYSRLVATLGKYLPDVSSGLVSHLDDEFRSLQRRKQKDFLGQVRTGNVRYLAELTKFGVVPEHVIFHCLKVSLDDFSRMNIEIICNLLENCGRYLLRNPDTTPRMKSFLETLQRKKGAHHLGQQERMLIENALYYVNPPERAAIQQKERTPVDLYVRKLVYLDMNKRTYASVLKSIRKLHWEECEVVAILEKIFSKPGKVKYSNIHLLAILVGALYRYHHDFVVSVIDTVLENITLGLESNDFQFHQRRIAEVKYLGELYNYKMVDSPVVFDTMYRIVTFGHPNGTPSPGRVNQLDIPDDYFRIRLVCHLLDTCGVCFDRGPARKKLDFFLTFFQYYLFTKEPMPVEIDFLVQDTFALTRPQWQLAQTLEEAGSAFADAVAQNYKSDEAERVVEADEAEEFSSSGGDGDEIPVSNVEEAASSSEEIDTETFASGGATRDSDFDDDIVVTRQAEERDPAAEAAFDRELARLMTESLDARKFERKPLFDVPLPMRRAVREVPVVGDESPPDGVESLTTPAPLEPALTMAFSLMTKKGNKAQTRTIELPSDSHFAVAMKHQQAAERAEQQRIKSLVLNYDRQETTDHDGTSDRDRHHNTSLHHPLSNHASTRSGDNKSGASRGARTRKLQLSDVDWT